MAKVDDILDEISAYVSGRKPAPDPARIKALLNHRSTYVMSKAAACAARFAMKDLLDDLKASFARLLDDTKADPGCTAKKGIINALSEMALEDAEWFLAASDTVQHEPAMGGRRDSAVEVRVAAIQAFCRFEWYKVSRALTRHIGDPEPKVRMAAIATVAAFGGREAELVILTKTYCGDPVTEVTGECFRALNSMEYDDRLELFDHFMRHAAETVGLEAAFAIGESKLQGAFKALKTAWDATIDPERRKVLKLAISTLRTPEASKFIEDLETPE